MAVSAQMRAQVSQLYVAMFGRAPDGEGLGFWVQQLSNGQSLTSVADTMFAVSAARAYYPSFMTNSEMVTSFYTKVLGRTPDAEGLAFWTAKLNATGATPGSVINQLITAVTTYAGTDAAGVASKALFMNKATVAQTYGESNGTVAGATTILGGVTSDTASVATATALVTTGSNSAVISTLTTGVDNLTGTSSDDTFKASILNNANTLQSGDVISGGAGNDILKADIGNSQVFAITAETSGIETVAIRAQAIAVDTNNNNMTNGGTNVNAAATDSGNQVQIDAELMKGVTQWESNNSRADVVIEDVRILPTQITKDITIAMVETDPGHVDFGVYFDQYSLRAQPNTSATLALQLMDTRSNAAGTGPLKDNPYSGFAFYLTAAGSTTPKLITVSSKAIDDALTYADLLTAIKAAVAAVPELASFTVALGANFTVSDTLGTIQTGQTITLTSNAGGTISATGTGAGWVATGTVPASSGLHTNMGVATNNTTDLVTSKIILDDVGRGSTGGDLVVGGLSVGGSVGGTSSSMGVQRFEIEVRDNSKLETINSTNNTLREVTIKNGVTSSSSFAYVETVKDAGNLTVNGVSGVNGGNVGSPLTGTQTIDAQNGKNAPLPGSLAQTTNGYGFSDVRLIDASEFKGKLAFTAEVTQASIAKYLNLKDIAALPAGDNVAVAFAYTGGLNDDTMVVQLDSTAVSSRSTIVAGGEDFTFTANGGAGNDDITVNVSNMALATVVAGVTAGLSATPNVLPSAGLTGGAQAWYTNQKLNANVFVNGGDGNDTIRTPGAGDVIIDGGAGNDTIYTDNTGALAIANATGASTAAATAYSNAAAAELAAAIAAAVAANTTSAPLATAKVANLVALDAATLLTTTDASVMAATAAAVANGSITAADKVLIDTAYGTASAPVMTAAEFAAGEALVASALVTARAAAAVATAADTTVTTHLALLNPTQTAVLNATMAMNQIADPYANVPGATLFAAAATAFTAASAADVNAVPLATAASAADVAAATSITTVQNTAAGTNGTAATNSSAVTTAAAVVGVSADVVAAAAVAAPLAAAAITTASTAAANAALAVNAVNAAATAATAAATAETAASTAALAANAAETAAGIAPTTANVIAAAAAATAAAAAQAASVSAAAAAATAQAAAVTAEATAATSATAAANAATIAAAAEGVLGAFAPAVASALNTAVMTAANAAAGSFNNAAPNLAAVAAATAPGAAPLAAAALAHADYATQEALTVTAGNAANAAAAAVATAAAAAPGTTTIVNGLATLQAALATNAADAAVFAATAAAVSNGSLTAANRALIDTQAGAGTLDAVELAAVMAILAPLQATAVANNTAAAATLAAATSANVTAVNGLANAASANPTVSVGGLIAPTFAGVTGTATALTNANTAKTAADITLRTDTAFVTNLNALKAAIVVGTTDTAVQIATAAAVANGSIDPDQKTAIDLAATSTLNVVGTPVTPTEKTAIDAIIDPLVVARNVAVAVDTILVSDAAAIVMATTMANQAAINAAASGANSLFVAAPKAVFVVNTANQLDVVVTTPTTVTGGYNLATNDDRNLADLKSDANNSYNLFQSKLTVTFKGIDVSVTVASTDYKTSDLQINQAIKDAINGTGSAKDTVNGNALSKLLVATDGPGNTLVLTSLIDGVMVKGDLSITLAAPTTGLSATDIAKAATAYGFTGTATESTLIGATGLMTVAKAAFDTKGDYVAQLAETGAAASNVQTAGAASLSSSDNTVTGGVGNDVIVLGTTARIDTLTSSNEKVVFAGTSFGNDVVVNFAATGLGMDTLDFTALKGSGAVTFGSLSLDKSIVVALETSTTNDTAAKVAALFTDSATAMGHVYIAYDANNVGKVYAVTDAAGVAAGNVTAALVGTIDLADTGFASLTAANFA